MEGAAVTGLKRAESAPAFLYGKNSLQGVFNRAVAKNKTAAAEKAASSGVATGRWGKRSKARKTDAEEKKKEHFRSVVKELRDAKEQEERAKAAVAAAAAALAKAAAEQSAARTEEAAAAAAVADAERHKVDAEAQYQDEMAAATGALEAAVGAGDATAKAAAEARIERCGVRFYT